VIAAHLRKILGEEGIAGEDEALRLIADGARGSMRDALSLLDQAIAYSAGNVTEVAVRAMLGAIDEAFLFSILDALARGDAAAALAVADDMQSRNVSFDGALQDLATLLHRVALAQAAPDALQAEGAARERLLQIAAALDREDVQLYYQIAVHGREDLPLAPDEYAGFTMALLRMLAFTPGVTGSGSVKTVAAEEKRPVAGRRTSGPAPVARVAFDGDWPKLASSLKLGGIGRQLAQASELKRFEDDSIELCVPPAARHLVEKSFQDKLRAALQEHFGKPMRLTVQIGDTAGNTARDRAAAAVSQDAFVRDLVENFDATIVESSIKPAE
jgi:DNA polymerase-3 subunit gamma/tau